MYKEIEQVKSFDEMEEILIKQSSEYKLIDEELKSLKYRNLVKKLGARYLIKKTILDFLGLSEGNDEIEIENEDSGKPVLSFRGIVDEKIKQMKVNCIKISISHSRNYVATLVVIE